MVGGVVDPSSSWVCRCCLLPRMTYTDDNWWQYLRVLNRSDRTIKTNMLSEYSDQMMINCPFDCCFNAKSCNWSYTASLATFTSWFRRRCYYSCMPSSCRPSRREEINFCHSGFTFSMFFIYWILMILWFIQCFHPNDKFFKRYPPDSVRLDLPVIL